VDESAIGRFVELTRSRVSVITEHFSQPKQRAAFHKSLAEYICNSSSRRGPEGALREVDAHLQKANPNFSRAQFDVLVPLQCLFSQRNLAAETGSTGGYLVPTEILSPVEQILRPVSVLLRAGARVITLGSNAVIPRQTASNSFSWLAQTDTVTLTDQTLGQITLTPKRLSGGAVYTRQLAAQSTLLQEEQFDSLGRDAMSAFEKAALQGTGNVQPLGIFNAPVTNTVTFSSTATLANYKL